MRPPLYNKVMGRTFFDIVAFKGRLIFMPIWGELFSRRLFEWDQIAFSLPNKNGDQTSNWLNWCVHACIYLCMPVCMCPHVSVHTWARMKKLKSKDFSTETAGDHCREAPYQVWKCCDDWKLVKSRFKVAPYSGRAAKKRLSPRFQMVKYHQSPRYKLPYSSLEPLPIWILVYGHSWCVCIVQAV